MSGPEPLDDGWRWRPDPEPPDDQADELAAHPDRWAWVSEHPEGTMRVGPGLHPCSKAFALAVDDETRRVHGFGLSDVLGHDPFATDRASP